MYAVRSATHADLAGILDVDAAVVGDRHDEAIIGPAIDAGRVLVAEEDTAILAYLRWERFWDTIPLCLTVRVRPDHQRRGIGRALYGRAEEYFRAAGIRFWLSSTEETNKRSLLFHEALGFRRIGTLFDLGRMWARYSSGKTWNRPNEQAPRLRSLGSPMFLFWSRVRRFGSWAL
jgi:L-amino acid N-acyltransferase YncA